MKSNCALLTRHASIGLLHSIEPRSRIALAPVLGLFSNGNPWKLYGPARESTIGKMCVGPFRFLLD